MKERPMLFSAQMVRALLDGTKTQTRREVKPQFPSNAIPVEMGATNERGHQISGHSGWWWDDSSGDADAAIRCPYGHPGDRLWVRETWNWFDPEAIPEARRGKRADFTGKQGERKIEWCAAYAADGALAHPGYKGRDHWRPSIHMPRWASRITLEITGVRVERLQDISEADAKAEGCEPMAWSHEADKDSGLIDWPLKEAANPYRNGYAMLWESLNGPGSWAANPWVWVVDFKRLSIQRHKQPLRTAAKPDGRPACCKTTAAA